MDGSISYRDPLLINTLGHRVGVLQFGVLVVLLFKDQRHNGVKTDASLANCGAAGFSVESVRCWCLPRPGLKRFCSKPVVTFSFSVLSVLPAVLLQLVLKHTRRTLVICGYLISGLAVFLHLVELATPPSRPHQAALLLISAGFGLVVCYI